MRRTTQTFALVFALLAAAAAPAAAQTWTIDQNHSSAGFAVRHMMVTTVRGAFGAVSGTVQYDGQDISKAVVDVTIDASSIDTRVDRRDEHLRSADFFDVANHPSLTFKSKRIEQAGDGRFKLIGDLTIRGVTREVTLDGEGPAPPISDGRGNLRSGATATGTIDRTDFGLTWNRAIEAGGVTVGNEVTITIDVAFVRPA